MEGPKSKEGSQDLGCLSQRAIENSAVGTARLSGALDYLCGVETGFERTQHVTQDSLKGCSELPLL